MARSIDEILTPEIGKILRQAREARGLSVADAAARLRLNPLYIESMESGDLKPLPPGPYRKAFLTEYAKFLNIKLDALGKASPAEQKNDSIFSSVPSVAKKVGREAASIAQDVKQGAETVAKKVEEGVKDAVEEITAKDLWQEADQVRNERLGIRAKQDEEPRISVRKRNISAPPPKPTAKVDSQEEPEVTPPPPKEIRRSRKLETDDREREEFIPIYQKKQSDESPNRGMSTATKLIVGFLVLIAAIVGYSIFSKKQSEPVAVQEPESKVATKTAEQKPKVAAPVKKDSVSAPFIASSSDSLIFIISAKDSVWVSVSPDIGNGFRGKLAKGEVRRFSAKEKYFLFLGNQKSVSMTLDGKPLSNLPTVAGSGMVVRNAVLTRDRVSVAQPEQNKSEKIKKEIPVKKKEAPKKKEVVEKKKQPPKKKKATKVQPINKQIQSINPVLPR